MRQVAHVLLTRPPLNPFPKELHSLDLHVLGTPPAFVLSQDQTLNKKFNLNLKNLLIKELLVLNYLYLFIFQRSLRLSATRLSYHLFRFLSTSFFMFFQHFFVDLIAD